MVCVVDRLKGGVYVVFMSARVCVPCHAQTGSSQVLVWTVVAKVLEIRNLMEEAADLFDRCVALLTVLRTSISIARSLRSI